MDNEVSAAVVINIEKKREALQSFEHRSFEHSICRVPHHLRKVNEQAYEPQVISIGPYHRGKDHLKAMDDQKTVFLEEFLGRNSCNLQEVVKRLRELKGRAWSCYAEESKHGLDEAAFVEMMVFDGCFIVELFIGLFFDIEEGEPIFQTNQIVIRSLEDMLLVENQLPFFILMELFSMTGYENKEFFINCIIRVFNVFSVLPGKRGNRKGAYSTPEAIDNIHHLLALIHENWQPPSLIKEYGKKKSQEKEENGVGKEAAKKKKFKDEIKNDEEKMRKGITTFPICAVELRKAGIEFKKNKDANFFDISFDNGIIGIPTMRIHDNTERIIRNLIVYEELNEINYPIYVSGYMKFMDGLVNSKKDVEIFCLHGIFETWLDDRKAVATLFNKIMVNVSCEKDIYADITRRVNTHRFKVTTKCKAKWKVWKANLCENYFSSPWALMSVLAAIALLLLTCTQTVYSVLSYSSNKFN